MKRALAERAKQQINERQQLQQQRAAHPHHLPNTNNSSNNNSSGTVSGSGSGSGNGSSNSIALAQSSSFSHDPPFMGVMANPALLRYKDHSSGTPPPAKIARTDHGKDRENAQTLPPTTTSSSTGILVTQANVTGGQNALSPSPSAASTLASPAPPPQSSTHKKSSKKRIRPPASVLKTETQIQPLSQSHLQDVQNVEESSAFYLKHQNKALASELYQYRYMIGLLSKERDKRREECRKISHCLRELVGVWDVLEGELCSSLGRMVDCDGGLGGNTSSYGGLPQDMPASTGNGTHVEETQAMIQSILSLACRSKEQLQQQQQQQQQQHHPMKGEVADAHVGMKEEVHTTDCQREMEDMEGLSTSVQTFSERCQVLHKLILQYVQKGRTASTASTTTTTSLSCSERDAKIDMEMQLHSLRGKVQELEVQMQELARARDDASERERRVRRGLYRVATGRLDVGEVLKAVEKDSTSTLDEISELEQDVLGTAVQQQQHASIADVGISVSSEKANGAEDHAADQIVLDGKVLTSADVQLMKKKIDDLTIVTETKEKRLEELMQENLDKDKAINNLISEDKYAADGNGSEKDVRSSKLYIEMSQKLSAAERKVESLTKELSSVMERWAVTKGDLESYQNTIKDLEEKHSKRLKELMGDEGGNNIHLDQSKLVMELEHKLKHALDNVRQSELVKISLADSQSLNETLQRRIGELKALNEQLEAEVRSEGNADPQDPGNSKDKLTRLKRDYSELKYKYEQNEKERTSLVSMNMRLQQQSIEKDDMNAKSLSTILHLKQITEKLEEEKDSLEKNLKSAQQLALASRLAANAKTRVEEEAMREKADMEEQMKQLQNSLDSLDKDKNDLEEKLAIANAKVESSMTQMNEMKKRLDELVSTNQGKEQRYQKMEEELVIAKKDLIDAAQKAATSQAQAGNSSDSKFETNFTAEELTIQVNQLKSRLACPVCNTRDKKVIITRCRHMFCRNCVAANLEGRNRKCPSCGIKFDKKDVEDVWF